MALSTVARETRNHRIIIDSSVLDELAEEIVISANPKILNRPPKVLNAFTAATARMIAPSLEGLAEAYRSACSTPSGRAAAQLFLSNLLEAEA